MAADHPRPRPLAGTTGWGIVAAEGNRLAMSPTARSDRSRSAAAERLVTSTAARRVIAITARRRGGRGSVRQQEPAVDAEARPGARRRADARRGRAGIAGRRICHAAGQEGGGRHRGRRKGAGPGDAQGPAAGGRSSPAPMPPTRWRWRSRTRITSPPRGGWADVLGRRSQRIRRFVPRPRH